MKIAILAWGSLIWENGDRPLEKETDWELSDLTLPLEFSRVSASRDGALTLVIDPKNGAENPTSFAVSAHQILDDAICNLRKREGTTTEHIGYVDRTSGQNYTGELSTNFKDYSNEICDKIRHWAEKNNFDAVIWTALPSNFCDKTKVEFTVDSALKYLHGLKEGAAKKARNYIRKAPKQVETPLRKRMCSDPWLNK